MPWIISFAGTLSSSNNRPFFLLTFATWSNFPSKSVINAMSPTCHMLLKSCRLIINPGSTSSNSHRVDWLYRLNKFNAQTHPCLTPLLCTLAVRWFSVKFKELHKRGKHLCVCTARVVCTIRIDNIRKV